MIDWQAIFVPSLHLAEVFIRGTLVFFFLLILLRTLRREGGSIGLSDVLVLVLIADASQNAMAGTTTSFTEGAVLVATIAFWDYLIDWLAYRVPAIDRLLRAAPLLLVRDGRLQTRNLRAEMLSEADLMSQLRQNGVESVGEVRRCYIEADGKISVIRKSRQ